MRIAYIVPYFGKLPDYFSLVLKSCEKNADLCDWFFFTDDKTVYQWPSNTKVIYIEFDEIRKYINSRFDFEIPLKKPYKFCDLKPAYGYIFEEYLMGYDYWGHCDIDCIFGKISHFIDDKILDYDKILRLGHMTIYKNTVKNNRRFMDVYDGRLVYKEAFLSDESWMFDEDNYKGNISVNDIWKLYGYKELDMDDSFANIWYKGSLFRLTRQLEKANYLIEKYRRSIFFWNDGVLERFFVGPSGKLEKTEYLYIHLMARKMKLKGDISRKVIKIIPNSFILKNDIPSTIEEFKKEKTFEFNIQCIKIRIRNLKTKINKIRYGRAYNDR